MSEAYERERCAQIPSPSPNLHQLNACQTKQRLPLRPTSQSLRPPLRHRRHLRQCARPARHRQHLRVLLQHDDKHQRQCAEIGSHGEPRQQGCGVEVGGDYCCDGGVALVDFELVLVKGYCYMEEGYENWLVFVIMSKVFWSSGDSRRSGQNQALRYVVATISLWGSG